MGAAAAFTLLFVGNSLSAANDLPRLLEAMGKASNVSIHCAIVAKPDFSLEDHWKDPERAARTAIARGTWSHVILQQGPSALPSSRKLLREYARRFDSEIRHAGATPAMLAVWPSSGRRGDYDAVAESYRSATALVSGELFPVGTVWRAAWARDPSLALYAPDGFHPSPLGTYLAALVIFHRLTGRLPEPFPLHSVSAREAEICRAAVLAAAR